MNCRHCKKLIPPKRVRRHCDYCSNDCRKELARKKWQALNPGRIHKSPAYIGAISELQVSSDLLLKGFQVFRALSPDAPCDLVVIKDDLIIRVQVKTGSVTVTGKLSYGKSKKERENSHDLLAITTPQGIIYRPDLERL